MSASGRGELRRGVSAVLLAALLAGRMARADVPRTQSTAPSRLAAVVVPPRLISPVEIVTPENTGNAVVVLALTIKADGSVRASRAIEGEEPLAGIAAAAALTWHFEPAKRGGTPVASIIRFEVTFHARVTAPKTAPAAKGASAGSEPAVSSGRVTPIPEVQVVGVRPAPEVSSFTRAEVRQIPGTFGDPFRAIEAMPGVTPIVSGLPFFYVRGAPPGNVGYFLDGVRVPYLFHVGLGPSVIQPAMVDRVDLYPGGYPARFGRFAGGIVSGETTAPRDDLHGEGNIRLFDAGAMVETGFDGGRGTVLVGGRYSYTAAILSLIVKNTTLDYRDYQARVTYDITPRDQVTAFGFGSYDLLGQTTNNVENILFGSEFYRLDLRYDHSFGTNSTIRTAVTLGYDQTRAADQRNAQDRMVSSRVELHHPVSKGVVVRAGADVTMDGYTEDKSSYVDPDDPTLRMYDALFPARTDVAVGAWVDSVLDLGPRVQVTPGVRVDLYTSGGAAAPAVDPRISARFKITDHFRIVHAYGLVHQPPSFVVPIPGLVPGNLQGGLQTGLQTSAGVEMDLPEAITATATVFDNLFFNMTDALGTSTSDLGANLLSNPRSLGHAVGFELFIKRNLTKRLGGFLTYTLSRSTRMLDGETFPSAFDRTHVANLALAYDLGRNWRAGTRLVFYTGVPQVTEVRSAIPLPPTLSPERTPPFWRIDLRLEKKWRLGRRGWISFVAEFLNATLNKETIGTTRIGPVSIPSIGVEAGY